MLFESDLNTVKGLLHYLNENLDGDLKLDDVKVIDSNGESVGVIAWDSPAAAYVLKSA